VSDDGEVKEVAVKVLSVIDEEQSQSFVMEAQFMMKLDHQCIVQLLGSFILKN